MEKRKIAISLPSTGDDEWQAVREPLKTGWLTQGPKVAAFEKAFAKRHQVKHALATTSCTTGLHLILAAAGIGAGDEVIIPAFTWVSTANVVLYCGATPVFVDVSPVTNNINTEDLVKRITPKTKAVIAVHLFGLCADIPYIRSVLPPEVLLVEDCACAAGASLNGIHAGGLGDAGAFSFHPRKSITTGEGGMVTTNNDALAETANILRNHGASISEEQRHTGSSPYLLPEFNLLGFNYRMTDIQGAVGLVQLGKLDRFIAERQQWAEFYREQLYDISWLRLPCFPTNGNHAWQAFVTYVDPDRAPVSRNQIMEQLQSKGIATRPGTHAVHMLGYYRDLLGLKPDDFPGAKQCNDNTMAIPLHNRMTAEDYEYVVKALKEI
ncbi:DegT/DnrJ/EryC1/StrS family aminotransferase [Pseudanabaena sp. Chao 1811]|uniref:DegT/DnrJ/EryC1/StrS family aminotransferase n=1 Tax=Pseudanabaena sp. Chao 1811 TaxID=2963092 RepID=UPI0022F3C632|nr:DegT/DnrJ/EryC1/StrS family aminotransferase [Pseudanabaena sp. Chao 1811]